ncbi:MAG: gamma-glutamyltransferase [Acidobacteriota bacterium]
MRSPRRRFPGFPRVLAALLLGALLPALATGASRPPQQFSHGVVVSTDSLASLAGVSILERGGNAADAAVATALALAVVHPQAGNLLGGHFSMWRGQDGHAEVIDGREVAPSGVDPSLFLDAEGHPEPRASLRSPRAIGVPGTVPALALLHARHGKLPWSTVVEPARRLAADGFFISSELAGTLRRARPILSRDPDAARIFYPHGASPSTGDRLVQKDLALTLKRLQEGGPTTFQSGEVAAQLAQDLARRGAPVTRSDLSSYRPIVRSPIVIDYRGWRVLAPPLPSAGGVAVAQALGTLRHYSITPEDRGGSRLFHLLAETLRRTFADRFRWLGDPDFIQDPLSRLLNATRLDEWSRSISLDRVTPSAELFSAGVERRKGPGRPESEETTHFSIVDHWGNAVSQTTTLNTSFGTGMIARGTGLFWNNEMDDFAIAPGLPNTYGIPGSRPNAVVAGKRPLSSMSPTIVERDGHLSLVLGSPGGSTIPSTIVEVLLNIFDLDLNIQEAVDAPRIHHQGIPDFLQYEPGALSPDVRSALERRGHRLRARSWPQGDVQVIRVESGGALSAAADPRRGGAARGY